MTPRARAVNVKKLQTLGSASDTSVTGSFTRPPHSHSVDVLTQIFPIIPNESTGASNLQVVHPSIQFPLSRSAATHSVEVEYICPFAFSTLSKLSTSLRGIRSRWNLSEEEGE
jgi:hypothetical protein